MGDLQRLNNMCDAANQYGLATQLNIIIALLSELKTNFNSLLTKLDSDAGVTDTDYSSSLAASSSTPSTIT